MNADDNRVVQIKFDLIIPNRITTERIEELASAIIEFIKCYDSIECVNEVNEVEDITEQYKNNK